MNEMTVNYTKTKKELFNIVKTVFERTNDLDNYDYSYAFYYIGVKYNNGVCFEYEPRYLWDNRNIFWNYFKNHIVEDVDFIYVVNMDASDREVYISKKFNITDINEFFSNITETFAKKGKYLKFMNEEGEIISD
jgi:hypothetical protein